MCCRRNLRGVTGVANAKKSIANSPLFGALRHTVHRRSYDVGRNRPTLAACVSSFERVAGGGFSAWPVHSGPKQGTKTRGTARQPPPNTSFREKSGSDTCRLAAHIDLALNIGQALLAATFRAGGVWGWSTSNVVERWSLWTEAVFGCPVSPGGAGVTSAGGPFIVGWSDGPGSIRKRCAGVARRSRSLMPIARWRR